MDVLPAGALLKDGYYIVEKMLGCGGFGITYEAHDSEHARTVAIKEFFPSGCRREKLRTQSTCSENADTLPDTASRMDEVRPGGLLSAAAFARSKEQFIQSARILQQFRHPGIVTVYQWWEERGTAYMAMERLHGQTLFDFIEAHGPLDEAGTMRYIGPLADALDSLHRMGLLHLDVKPENVMVCAPTPASTLHERVVLFDFDLMQKLDETGGTGTRPLIAHCGTPGYAPLEQYTQHAAFGAFTDLYALSATTYHLLTAAPPPAAPDRAHDEKLLLPEPRRIQSELSPQLEDGVFWALEMAPQDRPQSVDEWRHALRAGRPAPLKPVADADANTDATPIATLPSLPQTEGWFRVTAHDSAVTFPAHCACCLKAAETTLPLDKTGDFAAVPYCYRCARHIDASQKAVSVTTAGMITGLLIALIGFVLTNIVLGPLGLIIHFGAMAYGALQVQSAESMMRDECCERKKSVCRLSAPAGKFHLGFRNLRYAHDFRTENESKVI